MQAEYHPEIICCVLANDCTAKQIFASLNEFLPNYEPLNLDYTYKEHDPNYVFQSEHEMLSYFTDNDVSQESFYWTDKDRMTNNLMLGAVITDDKKLIISLTFGGNTTDEEAHYKHLLRFLNSKIGVISYYVLPEYQDGADFIQKYKDNVYTW